MNEVIIVDHPGDKFDDIAGTALEVVKIPTVSYAVFSFNELKIVVKKDSTQESLWEDYQSKIKEVYQNE